MQVIEKPAVSFGVLESDAIKVYTAVGGEAAKPLMWTNPGAASGDGEITRPAFELDTLYGATPPVICTLIVLPRQAATIWLAGSASSGAGGGTGGATVPGLLLSVAVIFEPVASTMVNVSVSKQVLLVTAVNALPGASTGTPNSPTAVGKLAATLYGGVPPYM